MMELFNHVLKGDGIDVGAYAAGSSKAETNRHTTLSRSAGGRNVKSIVKIYERCSGNSKSTREEGKQDTESTMEVRRSPRLKASAVTNIQQPPVASPLQPGVLVDAAAKSPPEETSASDSSTGPASAREVRQGNRGVKRKSSSIHKAGHKAGHKAIVQAIENGSRTIADSIDRIHTATAQIAEDRVKNLEVLFHTEFDYLKKRDRHINRNQKKLVSAISGLTEIITTGLKNTARPAGDTSMEIAGGGSVGEGD